MKVTCLGSGNAYSDDVPNRNRSCYLIGDSTLLDCNPEILNALKFSGNKPENVKDVFISHFHADHVFGLAWLLNEYISRNPRDEDLNIIGPEGLEDYIEDLYEKAYSKSVIEHSDFDINFYEVIPDREYSLEALSFIPYEMSHSNDRITALGYKIFLGGEDKVLGYTGDTGPTKSIKKLMRDVDLFIVDCTFEEKVNSQHLDLGDIREIRKELADSTEVMITHMSEITEAMRNIQGIVVPEDLENYTF